MNNSLHVNDIPYKILCAQYSLLSFCCLSLFLDQSGSEAFRMSKESEAVVNSAKPRSVYSKMAKPKNPKYTEMVEDAIKFYNEKGGSSRQAILKYITGNYLVGENAKNQVKLALIKSVGKGRLVQTKGVGASGSFKLSKEAKEEAKKEEKKRLKREEKKALKDKENTASESDGEAAKKSKVKKTKKPAQNDGEEKETKKKKKKAATKKTKQNKETASKKDSEEKKKSKAKEKKSKGKAKTDESVKEKKRKKAPAKAKTSKIQ